MTYDTPDKLPQLSSKWGASEKTFVQIHTDVGRHKRLQKTVADYSRLIGRPVSLALTITRALDLFTEHLLTLRTAEQILVEKLVLLGITRYPIVNNHDNQKDHTT